MADADPERARAFAQRLQRLRLTPGATHRLLRVAPRTVRNWLAGERSIPETVDRVLDQYEALLSARALIKGQLPKLTGASVLRKIEKAIA